VIPLLGPFSVRVPSGPREHLYPCRQPCLHLMATTQVQVRIPEELVQEIDNWIAEGRFSSRSEAVKTIVTLYKERERTRKFYEMLSKESDEARKHPESLIPLKDVF
jgi:Arc/MetJ-type ribon-helix-helix transcriptional regulator